MCWGPNSAGDHPPNGDSKIPAPTPRHAAATTPPPDTTTNERLATVYLEETPKLFLCVQLFPETREDDHQERPERGSGQAVGND